MPSITIKEYAALASDGAAPLEPPILSQQPLVLGSTAVRSLQFNSLTKWVRMTPDVRARIKFGSSTIVADPTSQLHEAGVPIDYPVSAATSLYVSAILALDPNAPLNTVLPAITGTPTIGQVLTCSSGTWVGTATITYAYQWTRDGVAIGAATASTYTLVTADRGTLIGCTVTATNALGAATATAVGVQLVPVNTVAPAITGTATVGQTLTCSTGTWVGTSPVLTYQWQRGGVNISGATASTYVLVAADVGAVITCVVTATIGAANASTASAGTAAVIAVPTAPVNTVLPAITGSFTLGQTLTCSTGTWTGTATITYAYQWKVDGVDISGATAATRVVAAGDLLGALTCTVTATNGTGSASATALAANPAAPVNLYPPTIFGRPSQNEALSCSTGTWNSSQTPIYTYQWKRDGSNIGGATTNTYTLAAPDVGTVITVTVTATNGFGATASTSAGTPAILAP